MLLVLSTTHAKRQGKAPPLVGRRECGGHPNGDGRKRAL
jgi:hypothetical protein